LKLKLFILTGIAGGTFPAKATIEYEGNRGVSKVFWGQSKSEIKVGGTHFQQVKLGANFGGLK